MLLLGEDCLFLLVLEAREQPLHVFSKLVPQLVFEESKVLVHGFLLVKAEALSVLHYLLSQHLQLFLLLFNMLVYLLGVVLVNHINKGMKLSLEAGVDREVPQGTRSREGETAHPYQLLSIAPA